MAAALLAPSSAEARTCRYADNGRYPEVAKLTASGTTCTVARQVATQVDLEEGAEPRSLSVEGRRFRCRYRLVTAYTRAGGDWSYGLVRCTAGRRVVAMRLYS